MLAPTPRISELEQHFLPEAEIVAMIVGDDNLDRECSHVLRRTGDFVLRLQPEWVPRQAGKNFYLNRKRQLFY